MEDSGSLPGHLSHCLLSCRTGSILRDRPLLKYPTCRSSLQGQQGSHGGPQTHTPLHAVCWHLQILFLADNLLLPFRESILMELQIHTKSDPITLRNQHCHHHKVFLPESWRRDGYHFQLRHGCWPPIRESRSQGLALEGGLSHRSPF